MRTTTDPPAVLHSIIGETDLSAARTGAVRGVLEVEVVSVHGPDARRFANGMFTSNVRDLPVAGFQNAAMTDERGRLHGLLDIACLDSERFVLLVEGMTAEAFIARYERYLLFDDVEMSALPWSVSTVQGVRAGPILEASGIGLPEAGSLLALEEGFVAPRRRSPWGGFDVAHPKGRDMGVGCAQVDAGALQALRILAGIPAWPAEGGAKRLPHELGLRDTHLAFDKGCYIGQETINRVDVMGQVRRTLVGIRCEGAPPALGSEVVVGERVVGVVSSATAMPDGGAAALAVVRRAAAEIGTVLQVGHSAGGVVPTPFLS